MGEVVRLDGLDWGLYNKKFSVWQQSWTKQRWFIENKGLFNSPGKITPLTGVCLSRAIHILSIFPDFGKTTGTCSQDLGPPTGLLC